MDNPEKLATFGRQYEAKQSNTRNTEHQNDEQYRPHQKQGIDNFCPLHIVFIIGSPRFDTRVIFLKDGHQVPGQCNSYCQNI